MTFVVSNFKKLAKKFKGRFKKGNSSRYNREQQSGCFRCGEVDHIVKNCPLPREEQTTEQFHRTVPRSERKSDKFRRARFEQEAEKAVKAMMAAWGDSSEDEECSNSENELGLMAKSDDESASDDEMDFLEVLKHKVNTVSHKKLKKLVFVMLDTVNEMNFKIETLENELELESQNFKSVESKLKSELDIITFEKESLEQKLMCKEKEFENVNKCLENAKAEIEKNKLNMSKEKQKAEIVMSQNKKLTQKISEIKENVDQNRLKEQSPKVFPWVHNKNLKKGLGFKDRKVVKPVDKKYVGMAENIICFYCGKTGHIRFSCSMRKNEITRNNSYVDSQRNNKSRNSLTDCSQNCKKLRNDSCTCIVKKNKRHIEYFGKKKEPKWIWVPKTNL